MSRSIAQWIFAVAGLTLSGWAWASAAGAATAQPEAAPAEPAGRERPLPPWEQPGHALSVSASGRSGVAVPGAGAVAFDGHTESSGARLHLATAPGLTAHAKLGEVRWVPFTPDCLVPFPGQAVDSNCLRPFTDSLQRGEVGAGYSSAWLDVNLSVGQSLSETGNRTAIRRRAVLPQVLPAEGGANVAAPLWFRNSSATNISARGRVNVAADTSVDVGASLGRVRFLPDAGLPADDVLDQTTLSLGIRHGAVRGTLVGRVLEPGQPGAVLQPGQRWSGIDLGISVRLPWRGELNFGAQNLWTSGSTPLLLGPAAAAPDQGRVPYVQYHQDL